MGVNDLMKKFKEKVKENNFLWSTIIILATSSIYMEGFSTAAKRPFSLTDPSISYPFIKSEKYDNLKLFLICVILPFALVSLLTFIDKVENKFHRFYKTTTCYAFALSLAVFLTTFLKIRLAKLRPDFLARCGPNIKSSELSNILYDEIVCTAPLGEFALNDGYKSCPSGHSTLSMCGMLFLSIWLYQTYGKKTKNGLVSILCFAPMLVSFDVATSRIYDFKHDYYDILSGSIVGVTSTIISVVFIKLCDVDDDYDNENSGLLPI